MYGRTGEPVACGKISMACGIHYCLPPTAVYCEEYVCIHISDSKGVVYELPLLPNNTAEIFLHKSGAVGSGDWIFIIGSPAWR